MKKILKIFKENKPTLILFIVFGILFIPIHYGMIMMIGMSTDSAMNEYSVFLPKDLLNLIFIGYTPFIVFVLFGQCIPLIIILYNLKKSKIFNLKLYIVLLLIQSLPYSALICSLHANTSWSYALEKIERVTRKPGTIHKDMVVYKLCDRYRNLDNISDVKEMAKQDKLINSYEYKYISEYLSYIDYQYMPDSLAKVLTIYNQDYPNSSYIIFDKIMFEYLEMIDKFINEDLEIKDVHNDVDEFLKKNISYNPDDSRNEQDNLNYSLPIIITYETIKIIRVLDDESADEEYDSVKIKKELEYSLYRVKQYVEIHSDDHPDEDGTQLRDSELYIQYCKVLDGLIKLGYFKPETIKDNLNIVIRNFELDVKNPKLVQLQVLM